MHSSAQHFAHFFLIVALRGRGERAAAWVPPPRPERGYAQLYFDTVLQAEEGCDFAFLRGPPAGVPDEPAPGVT